MVGGVTFQVGEGREGRKEQSSSDKRRHKLRSTRLLSSFFPPLAVAQHRHTTKLGRRVSGLVNSRKIQNQWISLVRMLQNSTCNLPQRDLRVPTAAAQGVLALKRSPFASASRRPESSASVMRLGQAALIVDTHSNMISPASRTHSYVLLEMPG